MVDRVVLDVQLGDAQLLGQPRRAHERREARVEAGLRRLHRQQLLIPPQRSRPRLDQRPGHHRFHGRVVVVHLQRAQALAAHPQRLRTGRSCHTGDRPVRPRTSCSSPHRRPGQAPAAWCTDKVRTTTCTPARAYMRRQQLLQTLEVASRQQGHRRPRPRQERAQDVRILQRQDFTQQRHQRRASRLMPAVPHRLAHAVVVLRLQRVHQRQHPLQVEDRVPPRQRRPAAPPGPWPSPASSPASPPPAAVRPATSSAAPPDDAPRRRPPTSGRRRAPARRCRHALPLRSPAPAARRRSAAGSPVRTRAGRPPWPPRCCPVRPPSECRSPPPPSPTARVDRCGRPRGQMPARARCPPCTGGVLLTTVSLPAPSSRTSTMRARRYSWTATPSVSKPPPRLATEPGTTIVFSWPGWWRAESWPVPISDTKQKRYHGTAVVHLACVHAAHLPSESSRITPVPTLKENLARSEALIREAARRGRTDHLPQGAVHLALLLQVAAGRPVRPGRADSGADHRRRAGAGQGAGGGPGGAALRAAGGRRLSELGGDHRRRRRAAGRLPQDAHPGRPAVLREVLLHARRRARGPDGRAPDAANGFTVWKTRYATIGVLICWDQWYPGGRAHHVAARRAGALLPHRHRLAPVGEGGMGPGAGRRLADRCSARTPSPTASTSPRPTASATSPKPAPTASRSSATRSSPIRSAATSREAGEERGDPDRHVRPGADRNRPPQLAVPPRPARGRLRADPEPVPRRGERRRADAGRVGAAPRHLDQLAASRTRLARQARADPVGLCGDRARHRRARAGRDPVPRRRACARSAQ